MKPNYPALEQYTYLNTPEMGLISEELRDYRINLINKIMTDPTFIMDHRGSFIEEVRCTVSKFLDAEYTLTSLIPNFSFGFNALLEGMDSSFKFLLLQGDYPSINWPVEARDFDRCYAQIDERLEQNIKEAVLQYSPDVLCLSIVQYISGIKIDLNFLKELKHDHPDLIIIADATQYIGTELFRFRESGIDILAASCYKWMNAGNGNAFICFKQAIVDRIKPKFTGFNSVQGFKNERGSFMGHFEPGHQDLVSFGSLKKAIELKNNEGMESIQQQIEAISSKAKHELSDRNLLSESVARRQQHSSIYNLSVGEDLYKNLINKNILCSQRGDGIRVGFAHHNTLNDLERLLRVVDKSALMNV